MKDGHGRFRRCDEFIRRLPRKFLDDGYGSIDEKIQSRRARAATGEEADDCIALSLCSQLRGDSDTAVEYPVLAKKRILN